MDETILEAIRQVFPAGEPFTSAVVSHDCLECIGVAEALQGRTWLKADELLMVRLPDVLPLLTTEALCYFLPSFLSAAIRHRERAIGDLIIMDLERRRCRTWFSASQRVVIVSWIRVYYGPNYVSGGPDELRRLEPYLLGATHQE
jgi:hypothetical protein